MNLNQSQREASMHIDGPCMVVAGPGSGKTAVIATRLIYLITKKNIKPSNILVITFTKDTAVQMKSRFLKFMKKYAENFYIDEDDVTFGTFHSVFFRILRNSFDYSLDCVINDAEKNEYIEKALKICNSSKNVKSRDINKKENVKIKMTYKNLLKNDMKLDYDEMISMCYELLLNNPSILKEYQKKYKYVLVDEFQDINEDQYNIVKLICKSKNLFVVGDDDQNIYEFRGSIPNVFEEFKKDFPNTQKIILNVNYRSVKKIIDYTSKIVAYNKYHIHKNLRPYKINKGKIEIKSFKSKMVESLYVIKMILTNYKKGIPYREMAVLFRVNSVPYTLIYYLKKFNIPFKIADKSNNSSNKNQDGIDFKKHKEKNVDAISLSTFHASKGLEFFDVQIIDTNEGIIPHKKHLDKNDLESERRLFYVACTRAKDNLHIYYTKTFRKPSRFIFEGIE